MRRREFLGILSGAAAWPVVARAQPAVTPVVGLLNAGSFESRVHLIAAFRKGLAEAGYIEGRNVSIEYRSADNQFDRLPFLAAELVRSRVSVLAVPGGIPAALAAKAATDAIPVVFSVGEDPVKLGLVQSLNRPGGNVTGVSYFTNELGPKRLGLLREFAADAANIAVLRNPRSPYAAATREQIQKAGTTLGLALEFADAADADGIDQAFAALASRRNVALLVDPSPLFTSRRTQIVTLAARHGFPAMYTSREFAEAGGLMSYGVSLTDVYRQAGHHAGRILKGEKPSDMPVVQPTKLELVINLTTAKALGLTIPPTLLPRADEVIE